MNATGGTSAGPVAGRFPGGLPGHGGVRTRQPAQRLEALPVRRPGSPDDSGAA